MQDHCRPLKVQVAGKQTVTIHMFVDKLCHDIVGSYHSVQASMLHCRSGTDEKRLWNEPNSQNIYLIVHKVQPLTRDALSSQRSTNWPSEGIPEAKEKDTFNHCKTAYVQVYSMQSFIVYWNWEQKLFWETSFKSGILVMIHWTIGPKYSTKDNMQEDKVNK